MMGVKGLTEGEPTGERKEKIKELQEWEQYYYRQFEKTGKEKHKQKMIEIKDQLESLGVYRSRVEPQPEDFKPTHSVYDPVSERAIESQIKSVNPEVLKKKFVQSQIENDKIKAENRVLKERVENIESINSKLHANNDVLLKQRDAANQAARIKESIKPIEKLKSVEEDEQIRSNRRRGQGPPQSYQKFKPEKY